MYHRKILRWNWRGQYDMFDLFTQPIALNRIKIKGKEKNENKSLNNFVKQKIVRIAYLLLCALFVFLLYIFIDSFHL